MLLLYASYGALPIMLLHIYHTPADSVSVPPVGLLLGVGFVEPWRAPFLLLCFFNTFLPPAYALCQPQIADLEKMIPVFLVSERMSYSVMSAQNYAGVNTKGDSKKTYPML